MTTGATTETSAAPGWFRRALAVPFADGRVEVDGAPIHYLAWGEPGRRGLVFVHGGGAHAHWWTHVAAHVRRRLPGAGPRPVGPRRQRPPRRTYSLEQWTGEVMAVADAGGIAGPPVIVGHSMGGFVTIATAALHPDRLAGVGRVRLAGDRARPRGRAPPSWAAPSGSPGPTPTSTTALARFRTVPPQDHYLDYVVDHVARHSLRPVDGGWQWKFDRQVFAQFAGGMRSIALPYLPRVRCRLALLRSENGLVTADIGAAMYEGLGRVTPMIEIPEAGHHAMLDQPLLLLTALRTLLADWDHSEPHRRADAGTRRRLPEGEAIAVDTPNPRS